MQFSIEIFFIGMKTFCHLDLSKKTGHSLAQNRQRDDILKHFIDLISDSRLKKRIQDKPGKIFVPYSFILAQLQFLASLIYIITVLGFEKMCILLPAEYVLDT